ncbi:AMP-binding protein, partial [Alteromonas sp. ASW11-130]|uniref:AMP-binding protein n=1 Tax=Alteromonas sp. ASW11-130 TaxID=3015775 RepID=UPI002242081F
WYLFEQGESWLFKLTPAHLDGLYPLFNAEEPRQYKHSLVLGGEQLLSTTVQKWQSDCLPNAAYINEYGPTETVVGCATYTVDSVEALAACGNSVLIGRPIANTQLYVLDGDKQTPLGGIGELCIGGDGVTRGYQNRPELTAEKFTAFTTQDGECKRIYRSGDLVRYHATGELEYLGRIDEQVKLRGYRIELGEIESQLRKLAGVAEAAVVVQGEGSDKHLVGFVTPEGVAQEQQEAWLADVSSQLQQVLADYMQPSALRVLSVLPLTTNGKVNKRKLPKVELMSEQEFVAASTETEKALEQIWQDVLRVNEPLSVTANF